ncbi:helix-turn-helix domain-containing protein [Streptomyces sp. NPDC057411]|uniref:helix-turn-helix domain-containing protein n=1 Tax=unclassified Streptomyces TaxID=2593676 RepID=UPI003637E527
MYSKSELGEFLRSRRARLRPADVGLPDYGTRRRVPGLRREELAQLAGVSVDYYVRFEQGRSDTISAAVVDAIATALRLTTHERAHLHNLARPPRDRGAPEAAPAVAAPEAAAIRPGVRQLLDALPHSPAYAVGHRTDVLAWNRAAEAVFTDFGALPGPQRNLAHLLFRDDAFRRLVADDRARWSRQVVSYLRLRAGHRPQDTELHALIRAMTEQSPEFRELWEAQDVTDVAHGHFRFEHPRAGALDLDYEFLLLPADPGVRAVAIWTATPGTPTESALRALTATE